MQNRGVIWLLYAALGFFLAIIVSLFLFAVAAGGLWLFVYGDNPWPTSVNNILMVLFTAIFLGVWIALSIVGYRIGKNREEHKSSSKEVLLPLLALISAISLIVWYQFAVGNLGEDSDGTLCSQFCSKQGFNGSGMPPKASGKLTCMCYDAQGNEVIQLPIHEIDPDTFGKR